MAERWLVVDDSSTIQRVIKLAFQGYDVQIAEAESCQDAEREIRLAPVSLIIIDAALGGIKGVQDFLQLHSLLPQVPFIVLEGSYDNIDENQFRSVGFQYFLRKPFDAAQLLAVTRQALGRALPYRGEALASSPPPIPESHTPTVAHESQRKTAAHLPKGESSGFDLGLLDSLQQPGQAPQPSAWALLEGRTLAQTIIASVPPSSVDTTHSPGLAKPASLSLDPDFDTPRKAISFSLDSLPEDIGKANLGSSAGSSWDGQDREPDTNSWKHMPKPAVSNMSNLLEPMLHEEMEKLVRRSVEEYCRKHFAALARELVQRELERLTQDRQRLLMD